MTPKELHEKLDNLIIGQRHITKELAEFFNVYAAGLSMPGKPIGSFLLLGPTGTGKTRTVEALGKVLHNSEKAHIRVNCGEYQEGHEVAKLIGAPPGYLGHRETPPMFTPAKMLSIVSATCPISLILFDEIEKAHPAVFRFLLSILDKGDLKTGDNVSVNFCNSLIFLTSNLGTKELSKHYTLQMGLAPADISTKEDTHGAAREVAKRKFSEEFWNRLDKVMVYNNLTPSDLDRIFTLELDKLRERINYRFLLTVEPSAQKLIISEGYSPRYGARELQRTLHRLVVLPLADLINSDFMGDVVIVRAVRGKITLVTDSDNVKKKSIKA